MDPSVFLPLCVAVLAVAAAVLFLRWSRSNTSNVRPLPALRPGEACVELSSFESAPIVSLFPSISTVTLFEGDVLAAEAFLRVRVAEVVRANPWLEGRLVRGGPANNVHLLYRTGYDADAGRGSFAVVDDAGVCNPALGYAALVSRLSPLLVAKSGACIDAAYPEPPLFRVTLIRDPTSEPRGRRFAVCVSLCHAFADGHTFYNIYGMLSCAATPSPLIVERLVAFERDCDVALGGNDSMAWMSSAGAVSKVLWTLFCDRRARVLIHDVPGPWVEAQKRIAVAADTPSEVPAAPSFVSTNDVLTSWLWRRAGTDVGFMAVNLRGRIASLSQAHAGNYEALVAFQVGGETHGALHLQSHLAPRTFNFTCSARTLRRPASSAVPSAHP